MPYDKGKRYYIVMLNSVDLRQRSLRRSFGGEQRPSAGNLSQPTTSQQPSPERDAPRAKRGKSKKMVALVSVASVLTVASLGLAGFFGWKYFSGSPSEEEVAAKTTEKVVNKAGALFELPKEEEPTVAQIQDKSKLEDQEFFDKAQDGDYLLVYEQAKIALIYRESSDKLINVGPVDLPKQGEPQENPQGSVSGESTP